MFVVSVEVDVLPHRVDEFVEGISANAEASLRDEPGCWHFDVVRSLDDPLRFEFFEIYSDREAFEVGHRSAPHYQDWLLVVERCLAGGPRARFGTFVSGSSSALPR